MYPSPPSTLLIGARHPPAQQPFQQVPLLSGAPGAGAPATDRELTPHTAAEKVDVAAVSGAPATAAPFLPAPLPFEASALPHPRQAPPPNTARRVTGASVSGADVSGAPETAYVFRSEPLRPRPWIDASDGHTHGEELLYKTMWSLGRPYAEGCRRLVIGARTLARQVSTGMAYSNVQLNLDSLEQKLSIKCQGRASGHNLGMDYLIYDYSTIQERRRVAGMTHVIKKGRAVILTNAAGASLAGAPVSRKGAPDPGVPNTLEGAHVPDAAGALVTGAKQETNSNADPVPTPPPPDSNERAAVERAVSEKVRGLYIENPAYASALVGEGRELVPDLAADELIWLIDNHWETIAKGKSLNDFAGVLKSRVLEAIRDGAVERRRAEQEELRRWLAQTKTSQA